MALGFWIELEFGNVGFLRRGENRSTRRKTSRSKDENQQQTQPTYDTGTGSRTQATLVGGERSHHCAIPAPLSLFRHFTYLIDRGSLVPRRYPPADSTRLGAKGRDPGEHVLAVCHSVTSRNFAPSRVSEKRTPGY